MTKERLIKYLSSWVELEVRNCVLRQAIARIEKEIFARKREFLVNAYYLRCQGEGKNWERRVRNEKIVAVIPRMEGGLQTLQGAYARAKAALRNRYDEEVLPAEYRGMVCITAFLGYLQSGKTNCLWDGEEEKGAIRLFDEEKNKGKLFFDWAIDRAISPKLKKRQKVLYDAVGRGQVCVERLVSSVCEGDNTFLEAYCNCGGTGA